MRELWGRTVILQDAELTRREQENRSYLMELESDKLLYNFNLEAGRATDATLRTDIHGGWESPSCQLRGHFLGHWLSAAAMHIYETGDPELKAKADNIIRELALCQKENGDGWVGPIPEKYLNWIANGKAVWAPHYTLHKVFMGLVDMHRYTNNDVALEIAEGFALWFYQWSSNFSREQLDNILDYETGGILETWVLLYQITGKVIYRDLMDRYYRSRLFDPLLKGMDPLTNMHANTTIPEIIGCAQAYEVTGDEIWRKIVTSYWKQAVTERGSYVTGGQTCGEIWTPKMELSARLGEKNQEHCTVYNMMRLADYLFRWTKEPEYADYWERNLYNGIMAQAYWKGSVTNGVVSEHPDHGLLTYFLPLHAGAHKGWSSKKNDFFCCHGTVVQANAAHSRGIYYQEGSDLYICQYINSQITINLSENASEALNGIQIKQEIDRMNGSFHYSSTSSGTHIINDATTKFPHYPDVLAVDFTINLSSNADFTLKLRIPEWITGPATISVNGEPITEQIAASTFISLKCNWNDGDRIRIELPRGIRISPLPDDPTTAAFLYGPIALAGLCSEERTLYITKGERDKILVHENEREWGNWKLRFRTIGQDRGIQFLPLYEVGYDAYTVYFPFKEKND